MQKSLKIVFMGTPDFALQSLIALEKSRHNIALVITQPDKKKGRGRKVIESPIKKLATKLNFEIFQPKSIKDKFVVEKLKKIQPDILIVIAYGQILNKEVLNIAKYGSINVHASLLPKFRGAAPIQFAILNGELETGITTMRMDEGLDTGDILLQKKIAIEKKDNSQILSNKLAIIGADILIETIENIENIIPKKQDDNKASYSPILKKKDGIIDWNKRAKEIENFVKAMTPWPSAYTFINEKRFKIFEIEQTERKTKNRKIGSFFTEDKKKMLVVSNDFILSIKKIQSSSGKILDIETFLCGFKQTLK